MEALSSLWRDMFARRLGWAEHAYEDFLRKIDPDLATYFSGKEKDVYVVLYGKTQVGKTTLLLKLMGVNHEVAKTLRGGRGKGRSATVTVTRYTASPDDFWRLTSDSHTDVTLDDDGIVAELIALRERVEQGGFLSDRPVIIKIPRKHFTSERIHGPKVNILDLPGENASNEAEASHVRAVAQKYVPAADLVLLVGLGDDLSFMKPEALPIPEIGDWRYQPEKFRIITTFTTRAKSYKDFLSSIDNPTKEHFRERLLSELKTIAAPVFLDTEMM